MAVRRKPRWSARVMQKSDALDLERGVFTKKDPRDVARSLKRSAERSRRRKSAPFRSAMSMHALRPQNRWKESEEENKA